MSLTKRLTSLIICFCVIMCCFVGCGKDDKASDDTYHTDRYVPSEPCWPHESRHLLRRCLHPLLRAADRLRTYRWPRTEHCRTDDQTAGCAAVIKKLHRKMELFLMNNEAASLMKNDWWKPACFAVRFFFHSSLFNIHCIHAIIKASKASHGEAYHNSSFFTIHYSLTQIGLRTYFLL